MGPTVLTLPYALRGMGWALGLAALSLIAALTFYEYSLMSRVLDHCEARGRRHIRFRELAADVLGNQPPLHPQYFRVFDCSFAPAMPPFSTSTTD